MPETANTIIAPNANVTGNMLATLDLDVIVHRIADINAALALLDFGRENRDRLAALADERADLRCEIERRAALLTASDGRAGRGGG